MTGAWLGAFPIPLDWDRPWQVSQGVDGIHLHTYCDRDVPQAQPGQGGVGGGGHHETYIIIT